jgi:ATP-dependent Clp protease adapter protein ClpS
MNGYRVVQELENILSRKTRRPTVIMWNRLEGRPRRADFTRALKAEVRDPLWMLTRQWQMGEFIGEDAGSPVTAKIAWNTDAVTELHTAAGVTAYDPNLPMKAVVEARPIPLAMAGRLHNADLRLALGRQWRHLLESNGHGTRVPDFLNAYKFSAPDPTAKADFPITAHAAAWQTIAAVANRAIDGGALLLHVSTPGALASDGLGLTGTEKQQIDELGTEFVAWMRRLYFQPTETVKTWKPRNLEYAVDVSTPNRDEPAACSAPEYRGGRLDWYSFDAIPPDESYSGGTKQPLEVTSFMPATAQFDGMPNTRHWAFEEGAINFGDINPDTTDIAKLLLIEFGLVFANDWFLLPIDLPVGSLTAIRGLAVTNVFGERFWIEAAVTTAQVQNWQMFRLTPKRAPDARLFLPATTPAGLESSPVESVAFVRDEVSNMVWGIETIVQLPDGSSRRGREVALELHSKHQATVVVTPHEEAENDAKIKYVLMTSVAEHWIPFIPVHIEGDNREIQLQRAAMPRLLKGEEGVIPAKIVPRTRLLREGLDDVPAVSYYVAEEEIERAGTFLEARWQRCRWKGGRVVTWLGHDRTTGRGEAASGLAFDILVPKPPRKVE